MFRYSDDDEGQGGFVKSRGKDVRRNRRDRCDDYEMKRKKDRKGKDYNRNRKFDEYFE